MHQWFLKAGISALTWVRHRLKTFSFVPEATALEMPYYETGLEHKPAVNGWDLTLVNPVTDMLTFKAQGEIAFMGIEKDEWLPYGNLEKECCATRVGFMVIQ